MTHHFRPLHAHLTPSFWPRALIIRCIILKAAMIPSLTVALSKCRGPSSIYWPVGLGSLFTALAL